MSMDDNLYGFRVSDWAKALKPTETPVLNYIQKMSWSRPNYDSAIIGQTKAKHPVLARLLLRPTRLVSRASKIALSLAGYAEAKDVPWNERDYYDNCDCEVERSGKGLAGLATKLGEARLAWSKSEPIYDPEKVKEIDAAFAKAHPPKPMQWGHAEMKAKRDFEQKIIGGEEPRA